MKHYFNKLEESFQPESTSFAVGFAGPQGNLGYTMIADKDVAKKLIISTKKRRNKVVSAEMGLKGDWGCTSWNFYDGKDFEFDGGHDNSIWATPLLKLKYKDGTHQWFECWYKK